MTSTTAAVPFNAAATLRRAVAFTVIVLVVGLAFAAVLRFHTALFALFAAITLHIAVNPFISRLRKRGVHHVVATALVYLLAFVLIGGFLMLLLPFIVEQADTIAVRLPEYYQSVRQSLLDSSDGTLRSLANGLPPTINLMAMLPASGAPAASTAPAPTPEAQSNAAQSAINPLFLGVFTAIAISVMAFYWSLNSERMTYGLLLRVPEARREGVRNLIAEIEEKVGAFFRGQLVLCGFVGVFQLIAYLVIGLPYALVLAIIAFVCEAIPIIGPALGAVPAVLVALAIAPDKAVFVVISTVVIQQIESNVLVPRVMDRAVGVNAIVSILSIIAFSLLFGLVGALLAIPLAAVLQIIITRVLFQAPTVEANVAPVDLTTELQTTGGRDRVSVLRMEAREIAEDVRKQMRKRETALPEAHEQVEDALEAIALDLDSLLAQKDEPASDDVARNQSPPGTTGAAANGTSTQPELA